MDWKNKRQRTPKGNAKIDNPEKLATLSTQDIDRSTTKINFYMQANTNNVNKTCKTTVHRFHAEIVTNITTRKSERRDT